MRSAALGLSLISAFLGVMAVLAVLAFHYPESLTTPMLRDIYEEHQVRMLLRVGMFIAVISSVAGLALGAAKRFALLGLLCTIAAWLAGGPNVALQGPVSTANFYISLDWVLLDLVLIATLFISLERVRRLRTDQPILRTDWQLDLTHYVVNHLFNGAMVYLIFIPANSIRDALDWQALSLMLVNLPIAVQVIAIMMVTDFAQYWIHRASHRWPLLWRFHRVHHSVKVMDWLAGSRLHVVDILITRSVSLVPMTVLGFSEQAINIYLPILALQSVFIHCNVNYPLAWLRKVLATPEFHHWHHVAEPEHVDRNFSISLPIYDVIFGTYYCPTERWPKTYGLQDDDFSHTYLSHLLKPLGLRLTK